jgi:hypothetical protein
LVVKRSVCLLLLGAAVPGAALAQVAGQSNVNLTVVADEANAALAILGGDSSDRAWQRLFASDGYLRLVKRESSFKRPLTEAAMRDLLASPDVRAKTPALAQTLAQWKAADVTASAAKALAYLPAGSTLRASVYPVIKPQGNSFVFELDTNPAIFLYLDPAVSQAQFANTVAHELHHVGYAQNCPLPEAKAAIAKLDERRTHLFEWIGAFGEGFAMLAAAGGPDIHPHANDDAATRARWDRDVANFDADRAKVEAFFLSILDGTLTGEAISTMGYTFFGVQGPWYTVGWKMSVTIERAFGRARLIACIADNRLLLPTYNAAAEATNSSDSRWPERLAAAFRA